MPDAAAARAKVAELFPTVKVICSAAPEVPGTRSNPGCPRPSRVERCRRQRGPQSARRGRVRCDLAHPGRVGRERPGGTIAAPGRAARSRGDRRHHARRLPRLELTASPYGVFLAGPSATGDIEGVIIHGAQGARSLIVLLLRRVKDEK